MRFSTFLRSTSGRILRALVGAALVVGGATGASMSGLLLTMIGLIPIVTAVANICLVADAYDLVARARHPAPRVSVRGQ